MRKRSFQLALRFIPLTLLSVAMTLAFTTRWAYACPWTDPAACVDGAEYSIWYGIASILWKLNSFLLLSAYQLDQFRYFLVTVSFSGAYDALTTYISPIFLPAAVVMLMIAALFMMIVPITGHRSPVDIRHILTWAILSPMLMTAAGPLLAQTEDIRVNIGDALFADASAMIPGAIFGPSANGMLPPTNIYPFSGCGTTMSRPTGSAAALHVDDIAAAMFYADAGDIACPDARGPSPDIPDGWYISPPSMAYDGDVGDISTKAERIAYIQGMQRGVALLFEGMLPSSLSLVVSIVNFLFSLSLMALWAGIPFALIMVLFQSNGSIVSGIFHRAVTTLQASWTSSFVIGLMFAGMIGASRTGSSTAVVAYSAGALILTTYMLIVAGSTLMKAIMTLNNVVDHATGVSLRQGGEFATAALSALVLGRHLGLISKPGAKSSRSNRSSSTRQSVSDTHSVNEVGMSMGYSDNPKGAELDKMRQERSWYQGLSEPTARQQERANDLDQKIRQAERTQIRSGLAGELQEARAKGDFETVDRIHNKLKGLDMEEAAEKERKRPEQGVYAQRDRAEAARVAPPEVETRTGQVEPEAMRSRPIRSQLQQFWNDDGSLKPTEPTYDLNNDGTTTQSNQRGPSVRVSQPVNPNMQNANEPIEEGVTLDENNNPIPSRTQQTAGQMPAPQAATNNEGQPASQIGAPSESKPINPPKSGESVRPTSEQPADSAQTQSQATQVPNNVTMGQDKPETTQQHVVQNNGSSPDAAELTYNLNEDGTSTQTNQSSSGIRVSQPVNPNMQNANEPIEEAVILDDDNTSKAASQTPVSQVTTNNEGQPASQIGTPAQNGESVRPTSEQLANTTSSPDAAQATNTNTSSTISNQDGKEPTVIVNVNTNEQGPTASTTEKLDSQSSTAPAQNDRDASQQPTVVVSGNDRAEPSIQTQVQNQAQADRPDQPSAAPAQNDRDASQQPTVVVSGSDRAEPSIQTQVQADRPSQAESVTVNVDTSALQGAIADNTRAERSDDSAIGQIQNKVEGISNNSEGIQGGSAINRTETREAGPVVPPASSYESSSRGEPSAPIGGINQQPVPPAAAPQQPTIVVNQPAAPTPTPAQAPSVTVNVQSGSNTGTNISGGGSISSGSGNTGGGSVQGEEPEPPQRRNKLKRHPNDK